MNPDLQNKIDLESEKYAEEKLPPVLQTEYHLIQHENSFKAGAKFVAGILQPEIDELKRSNVNLFDTVCDFERGIECLQSDRTKLENQLSEANATIQSLKDENKKFREALEFYANGGNPNRDIWFDEKLGYFTGKRARQTLEGVSK